MLGFQTCPRRRHHLRAPALADVPPGHDDVSTAQHHDRLLANSTHFLLGLVWCLVVSTVPRAVPRETTRCTAPTRTVR